MYVIRRRSDGWYYTNDSEGPTWHPNINQAQTYLAPPNTWNQGVWVEEREPWPVSLPVILGGTLAMWVCLYYLVRLLMAW